MLQNRTSGNIYNTTSCGHTQSNILKIAQASSPREKWVCKLNLNQLYNSSLLLSVAVFHVLSLFFYLFLFLFFVSTVLPVVKLAVIKLLAWKSAAIKYFRLRLMIFLFVFQFSQMLGTRAGSDWHICPGKRFPNRITWGKMSRKQSKVIFGFPEPLTVFTLSVLGPGRWRT